jgi:hypothetical protein
VRSSPPVRPLRKWCKAEDREAAEFTAALAQSDLAKVRRLINGGVNGHDGFSKLYDQVLAALEAEPPETTAAVAPR